jgi:hypothetical protein
MSTPVELLKLDALTEDTLRQHGYDTVERLLQASTSDILNLMGITPLALSKINEALDQQGLEWTGELPKATPLEEVIDASISYTRAVNRFLDLRTRRNYMAMVYWRKAIRRYFPSLSDVEVHRFAGIILEAGSVGIKQALKSQGFFTEEKKKHPKLPIQFGERELQVDEAFVEIMPAGEWVTSKTFLARLKDLGGTCTYKTEDSLRRQLSLSNHVKSKRVGNVQWFLLPQTKREYKRVSSLEALTASTLPGEWATCSQIKETVGISLHVKQSLVSDLKKSKKVECVQKRGRWHFRLKKHPKQKEL